MLKDPNVFNNENQQKKKFWKQNVSNYYNWGVLLLILEVVLSTAYTYQSTIIINHHTVLKIKSWENITLLYLLLLLKLTNKKVFLKYYQALSQVITV